MAMNKQVNVSDHDNNLDGQIESTFLEPRLAELILISSMYPKQLRCLDSIIQTAIDDGNYSINYAQTITALFTVDQYLHLNILIPPINLEQNKNVNSGNRNKLQVHCRIVDSQSSDKLKLLQEQLNNKLNEDNKITNDDDADDDDPSLIDTITKIIQIWNELNKQINPLPIINDLSLEEKKNNNNNDDEDDSTITNVVNQEQKLCRHWIYSHHIYSSTKRKSIIDLCKKLNLNGFMLIGKPGFICVEGIQEDCEEFWSTIRAWNWQRLTMIDDEKCSPSSLVFKTFKEYSDRSIVFRMLEAQNCDKIIKNFLGIQNTL